MAMLPRIRVPRAHHGFMSDDHSILTQCPAGPDREQPMLYAAQLRAGRALVAYRQEDLAREAGVGLATLQRIERSEGPVTGNARTIWKLQNALERAGVRFIEDASTIGVSRPRSGRLSKKCVLTEYSR